MIELTPPAGDYVGRIFLFYNDSLGWAFEFWEKHGGGLGVNRYMCTKNMVFLSPFTFETEKQYLPKEEYFDLNEEEMIAMVTMMEEEHFKILEKRCRERLSELSGLPFYVLPYDLMRLFNESREKQKSL
jgi:hypothetical protein